MPLTGKKLNFPIGESVGKLPQYWEIVGCIHPIHGKKWYTNRELLMHRLAGPNFGKQSGSFFHYWEYYGQQREELTQKQENIGFLARTSFVPIWGNSCVSLSHFWIFLG